MRWLCYVVLVLVLPLHAWQFEDLRLPDQAVRPPHVYLPRFAIDVDKNPRAYTPPKRISADLDVDTPSHSFMRVAATRPVLFRQKQLQKLLTKKGYRLLSYTKSEASVDMLVGRADGDAKNSAFRIQVEKKLPRRWLFMVRDDQGLHKIEKHTELLGLLSR